MSRVYGEEFLWCFKNSLHSRHAGAKDHWSQARATGLTDDELKEAISRIYGLGGGYGSAIIRTREYGYVGGVDPEFVFGCMIVYRKDRTRGQHLRGKALLELARQVLEIGNPIPEGQLALF